MYFERVFMIRLKLCIHELHIQSFIEEAQTDKIMTIWKKWYTP